MFRIQGRKSEVMVMTNMVLPFPYLKINKDLDIIDCNSEYKALIGESNIKKAVDLIPDFNTDSSKFLSLIGEKYYDVMVAQDGDCYNVFLIENPNINDSGYPKSNILIGVLIIDNYAEVQENMEEIRLPHLMAIVERKINDYFSCYGGITKKLEKDRYLFILNREVLVSMQSERFKICEQINKIEMGNIPVTLSIGIGMDGKTITQDMEYARGALDLALGRGGNQIVIKAGDEKYQFFGGDGNEVSRVSKVRARVKAYGFVELIMSASDVIIMGHKNPDLDSLGSAAGVLSIAKFYGKNCYIVLNEVTSSIKALYDRLIKDFGHEKVFITSEEAIKAIRRRTLLVVVDTHRPVLCECPELLDKTQRKVLLDHHRKGTEVIEKCSLVYHEAYASSTSELVTEMLMYIKGIRLSKTVVDGLLAGITVDTKNFAFKTGIKTFEASAYLKKNGADTIAVRRLFKNSFAEYLAMSEVVRNAEIINENMALSILDKPVDNPTMLIAQAADELLKIEGIEVSYVLCDLGCKVIISARSLGKINVQKLMEKLGGGGHQAGAAAQISGVSMEEAIDKLKEVITEYLKESK